MQTCIGTWILILFGMFIAVIWKVFTFGFRGTLPSFRESTRPISIFICVRTRTFDEVILFSYMQLLSWKNFIRGQLISLVVRLVAIS